MPTVLDTVVGILLAAAFILAAMSSVSLSPPHRRLAGVRGREAAAVRFSKEEEVFQLRMLSRSEKVSSVEVSRDEADSASSCRPRQISSCSRQRAVFERNVKIRIRMILGIKICSAFRNGKVMRNGLAYFRLIKISICRV